MNELWIPILGVICAVGMPVLLGIIASYMTIKSKHEEKMAMIEKGIVLEEAMRPERRPNRYNTLRNGIFMIGLSLGSFYNLFLSFPFFNGEGEIGGREENASGRINDTGWMSESG